MITEGLSLHGCPPSQTVRSTHLFLLDRSVVELSDDDSHLRSRFAWIVCTAAAGQPEPELLVELIMKVPGDLEDLLRIDLTTSQLTTSQVTVDDPPTLVIDEDELMIGSCIVTILGYSFEIEHISIEGGERKIEWMLSSVLEVHQGFESLADVTALRHDDSIGWNTSRLLNESNLIRIGQIPDCLIDSISKLETEHLLFPVRKWSGGSSYSLLWEPSLFDHNRNRSRLLSSRGVLKERP